MEPSALQASTRLPTSGRAARCRNGPSPPGWVDERCYCSAACGTLALLPLLQASARLSCVPAVSAGWLLPLLSRRPLASAPRWGEAVVEHEHTLHVEALGDVGDELVRGRRKGAVAVEELPTLAACEQSAAVGTRCCGRAHTSGSWAWRPSALRSSAVTVWNGASAGTLNLVVLRMGASPVCLKLTITFPSLTAEAEDGIVLGLVNRDGSPQVCRHGAAFTTRPSTPRSCLLTQFPSYQPLRPRRFCDHASGAPLS